MRPTLSPQETFIKYRIGSIIETLERVNGVLSSRGELTGLLQSSPYKRLATTRERLQEHVANQDLGARAAKGETALLRARLDMLHLQIRGLSAAASLALPKGAEFTQFRMPGTRSVERMLAAALGMVDAAGKHVDGLREAGMPDDFLENITAAASEVRESVNDRAVRTGLRRNATANLHQLGKEAVHLLKLLDAVVLPVIGSEPGLLAEWKAAKRIHKKPGMPRMVGGRASSPEPQPAGTPEHSTPQPLAEVE